MSSSDCFVTREAVVHAAMEDDDLPQEVDLHLAVCAGCRAFTVGVGLAPRLVAGGPALSPELRHRVVEAARPTPGRLVTAAAAVAGLVNLVGSLVLPTVVFARGLALVLPAPVALVTAAGLCLSLGLAATAVLIVVVERVGLRPALEVSP